jgi:hypothetical protein
MKDGGDPVGMARRSVQSKIHRRLRATSDRLLAFGHLACVPLARSLPRP